MYCFLFNKSHSYRVGFDYSSNFGETILGCFTMQILNFTIPILNKHIK